MDKQNEDPSHTPAAGAAGRRAAWWLILLSILNLLGTRFSRPPYPKDLAPAPDTPTSTPSPTPSPTPTSTPSPTPSPTFTATPSPTPSPTSEPGEILYDFHFENQPSQDNPKSTLDGYWHSSGNWVPIMINNETWYLDAPQHAYGSAVFYAPGIMASTAEWRGISLESFLGGVALMSPADIGKTIWMKLPGGEWEGPYIVVDCARRGDMFPAIYYQHEIVEVDFDTAVRWGIAEYGGKGNGKYNRGRWTAIEWRIRDVEVWVGDEKPQDPGEPVFYPDWWIVRAEPAHWNEARPVWKLGFDLD
jgi:hypothetical protein